MDSQAASEQSRFRVSQPPSSSGSLRPSSLYYVRPAFLQTPSGLYAPTSLPFLQLNNTAVVFIKLYAALIAGTCAAAVLCFSLPEFLPGKRALAIALCIYHVTCSTILYNAPRFIPYSFGPWAESLKATPELVWGTLHGFVGLGLAIWWQATVQMAIAMRQKTQ